MGRRRLLDHDTANRLYQQGLNDEEIASRCLVSWRTVQTWRLAAGLPCIERRPKRRTKAQPGELLVRRKKSQLSADAEEAREHGMNYGAYYAAYIAPQRQAGAKTKRGGKS